MYAEYFTGGNDESKFSVDTTTGKLSCNPLDRELQSTYTLMISATDQGSPARSTAVQINIRVLDDNDNDPTFSQPDYTGSVREGATINTVVLQVAAVDPDEGINGQISYAFNNAAEGLFKIDNKTGVIRTAGQFDREKKSSYSFEVHATDGGLYGPRTKMVRVDIQITDVNDNAPVFEEIPFRVNISQTHALGQYVTKLVATDKDEGVNGQVYYSFPTPSVYFDLNRVTGIISTKQVLDPSAVRVHRLDVTAADGSNPALVANGKPATIHHV